VDTLDAILDRLIPADDEGPGALALGLGPAVRGTVPNLEPLLARLAGFGALDAPAQDHTLRSLEEAGDKTFAALVMRVHELFYADPRAWPALGYTTRIPGRP
jgi:hypothetical protein